MKVVFSVYNEDFETWEAEFLYSKTIITNVTLSDIDDILKLHQGFRLKLEAGRHLAFWDIYCISIDPIELLKRIDKIPTVDKDSVSKERREPKLIISESFDPGCPQESIYPSASNCYVYRITRYECGANSVECFVSWASSHPWLMVFIGGFLWDTTKYALKKFIDIIRKLLFHERKYCGSRREIQIVYFSPKDFYKNFSLLTHIDSGDCQIISLKKVNKKEYSLLVKTVSKEYYLVECGQNGKILSLELVDDTSPTELLRL